MKCHNYELKLLKHNVILSKYGEDIYVDEMLIESNYPDEKGKKEKVLRITGNCSFIFEKTLMLYLTDDGIEELQKIISNLKEKQ